MPCILWIFSALARASMLPVMEISGLSPKALRNPSNPEPLA
jgi:hypothetical protein